MHRKKKVADSMLWHEFSVIRRLGRLAGCSPVLEQRVIWCFWAVASRMRCCAWACSTNMVVCACTGIDAGTSLCLGVHAQASVFVCVSVCMSVCVDCYSCSVINEVQVRVSIGF